MFKNRKNFKHLDTITAFFVAVLIISNVASSKIINFGFFTFDGGTLLFPLSYIFGDILNDKILGLTPRIVVASLFAFLLGEFSNSFVLAKLKIFTKGKWLWTRAIGSTIAGELIDSVIFISIAFWGIFPPELIISLKKEERENYFDYKTNFNPLTLKD